MICADCRFLLVKGTIIVISSSLTFKGIFTRFTMVPLYPLSDLQLYPYIHYLIYNGTLISII